MIFHQPGNSLGNYNFNTYYYTKKEYAPHFHKNLELICVVSGEMSLTINGVHQQLGVGKWALILSNQIHSFVVPEEARIWVAVFSEEYVPAFTAQIKGMQGSDFVFAVSDAVAALVEHSLMKNHAGRLMRKACFYAVCDEYMSQVKLEPRQDKTTFLVGQLLDWISVNYTENISLKMAAELFGYEYHYLSRLLNRNFAISFTDLLASYRVEHAQKLLRETMLPATGIAELSGFQSIRSFNLTFKKLTGKTPNDYRCSN